MKPYKNKAFKLAVFFTITLLITTIPILLGNSQNKTIKIIKSEREILKNKIEILSSSTFFCDQSLTLIGEYGTMGADVTFEIFNNTTDEKTRGRLILIMGIFEQKAMQYLPSIFNLIIDREGQVLSYEEYKTMLISIDAIAQIDPESEAVFAYLSSIVDRQYWTKERTPRVEKMDFLDSELGVERIRKHAIRALSWIGDKKSIDVLKTQLELEKERNNTRMEHILSWTVDFMKRNGSIKNYYQGLR